MYDYKLERAFTKTRGRGHLVIDTYRCPIEIERLHFNPDELPSFEGHILDLDQDDKFIKSNPNYSRLYFSNNTNLEIEKVIFNDPATIVIWKDGTKTVVKCQEGDVYDEEKGLALCISKKALGNKGNFNEVFKKWVPEEKVVKRLSPKEITLNGKIGYVKFHELVEDKKEDPKPQYYNGRVRCITSVGDWFTVGKIYDVVDGVLKCNDNRGGWGNITSVDDLNRRLNSQFEEVKEPSVKKMRYALDEFCEKIEDCPGCPLDCGYSCNFVEDNGHLMSDDQIKEAYKLAFGKKEDK